MQIELILILTLAWFSTCEKCRQGTTVLTDEYKKVMDQFDFSGFDKQEALNYIDRHRYENQIRGKRSGLNLVDGKVVRCNDEDEIYRGKAYDCHKFKFCAFFSGPCRYFKTKQIWLKSPFLWIFADKKLLQLQIRAQSALLINRDIQIAHIRNLQIDGSVV